MSGTRSKKPTRSQLLNEIAALTAFGTRGSDQPAEFEDGTTATEAVERSGQWVMDGDDEPEAVQRSKLRMAAGMDFDDDDRYKGKRVGRKALAALTGDSDSEEDWPQKRGGVTKKASQQSSDEDEEESEMGDEDQDDEGEEEGEEEGSEDEDEGSDEELMNGEEGSEAESMEDGDDEDDDEEGDSDEDGEGSSGEEGSLDAEGLSGGMNGSLSKLGLGAGKDEDEDEEELGGSSMRLLAQRSAEDRRARAERAQQQREAWNRLLELRILLQPLMGLANRLPRGEALLAHSKGSAATASHLSTLRTGLQSTLSELLTLRSLQRGHRGSSSRGGEKENAGPAAALFQAGRKRRREALERQGVAGMWEEAAEDYEAQREHWKDTLDRTHQRLCLTSAGAVKAAKKFRAVNQGLWNQVEASMADVDRRNRRCHLLQGQAAVVGQEAPVNADEAVEVDGEAYDDTELYQQLLREFMENTGDAAGVDPLWLAGRKGVKKSKKGVDRKASKGRKLRYAVHPKLEHFMFPVPLGQTPMDIDRLFASLPGSKLAR